MEPAVLPPGLTSEMISAGSVRARITADDAELVVWYTGEQEGELAPCGCRTRPLGGLPRTQGYVDRSREALGAAAAGILVNAGGWLATTTGPDGESLAPETRLRDQAVLQSLSSWDALNLSFRDLPYLAEHGMPQAVVSANVRAPAGLSGPRPYVLLERGGRTIAVTGVTALGVRRLQPAGWTYDDPVQALTALLPELHADVVVVLAYGVGPAARDLARLPGVDLLVEAGEFEAFEPAIREGDAVWVRSSMRGERLGELRVRLADGRIERARDRSIAIDPRIPADRELARLQRETDEALGLP